MDANKDPGPQPNSAAPPPPPPPPPQPKPGSLLFDDGKRRIDFVLVFVKEATSATVNGNATSPATFDATVGGEAGHVDERERSRLFFEQNLIEEGLQLELDVRKEDDGRLTIFVKVHAPFAVLCKQAELLRIKMPLKLRDTFASQLDKDMAASTLWSRLRVTVLERWTTLVERLQRRRVAPQLPTVATSPGDNDDVNGQLPRRVTWQFRRRKLDRFDVINQEEFFTPTQRIEMVWAVLQKARNDPDQEKRRGVEMLLDLGVYEAAFPLHDGDCVQNGELPFGVVKSQRQTLSATWATWKATFHQQPLDLIRLYYGEKIAFYFAFLGFYTRMLVYPGVIGFFVFLYDCFYKADDRVVQDICNEHKFPGNLTICPVCLIPSCEFTKLAHHCLPAQWEYRMDNETCLFCAAIIIAWATVLLKAWKRRETELAFEWDVYDMEQEDLVIQPEYERRAPITRPNPITRQGEPYIPPSSSLKWQLASKTVILLVLCMVGTTLTLLILARIALYGLLRRAGVHENVEAARWLVHLLIAVAVLLFDSVYGWVATKVTWLECPRTRSAWLSSYLWKVFVFALLNDFVPIFYAAWVKNLMASTPLDLDWKSELCEPIGCMTEVTELVAVLLLSRMVLGNAVEIGWPFVKHYLNRAYCNTSSTSDVVYQNGVKSKPVRRPIRSGVSVPVNVRVRPMDAQQQRRLGADVDLQQQQQQQQPPPPLVELEEKRWRVDLLLGELELDGVAEEYLEMAVQFAFCTLFVVALPVAPLFCLLNNILEIRVDSIKILGSHRRPLPTRVPGIGIWREFLNIIAKLAVVCNACLIAFTSDSVPRLYYKYAVSNGSTIDGYHVYSLSRLKAEYWPNHTFDGHHRPQDCYYTDLRKDVYPFNHTEDWWKVLAARLFALAAFLAFGFSFQFIYDALVPDVTEEVSLKIQRQRYVISKAMESEQTYEHWLKNHSVAAGAQFGEKPQQLVPGRLFGRKSLAPSTPRRSNFGRINVKR